MNLERYDELIEVDSFEGRILHKNLAILMSLAPAKALVFIFARAAP